TMEVVQAAIGGRRKAADALAKAVEAGVIEIDRGQIRFAHPLFGSAIFSEASSDQRRELHRSLAGIAADSEEQARHLALAVDGPDPDVAAALDEAARRAYARGAPDAAAELSAMAVRLTPPDHTFELLERSVEGANHHVAGCDTRQARLLLEGAVDAAPPGPARGA